MITSRTSKQRRFYSLRGKGDVFLKAGFVEACRREHAPRFDPAPYLEAEKESREAKKGICVQAGKHVSPRDWRRMQRAQ